MKYLFFDIECANCFEGTGKIYSFGYVLTDEYFKVISSKDILINPDVKKWDWYVLKNFLSYKKSFIEIQPRFDEKFNEINNLLEQEDALVIGFAVQNDIKFLSSECTRYNLKLSTFDYLDLYNLIKKIENREVNSLSNEYFKYTNKLATTAHRSDEDAFLTLEIFKELNNKHENLLSEIQKQKLNTKDYIEPSKKRKKKEEIKV